MNDFNLLPAQYRSTWKIEWVTIIIVATICVCAAGILIMEWHITRIGSSPTVLETSQRRRTDMAELAYLSNRVESLTEEYTDIDTFVTNHPVWSNLLIRLSGNLPTGVLVSSMSMNARQGSCSIQGTAADSQSVLAFKQILNSFEEYGEAAISTIARNTEEGKKGVAYEIVCQFEKKFQ